MNISLPPFAPESLVSRAGFDRPIPRQPAHLHAQSESGAFLRDSSRVSRRRPFIYLNRQTPSGQSRVIRSRICVPMAFTAEIPPAQGQNSPRGSSSNGCSLFRYHHGPKIIRASLFPHPLYYYWYEVGMCDGESIGGRLYYSTKTDNGVQQTGGDLYNEGLYTRGCSESFPVFVGASYCTYFSN